MIFRIMDFRIAGRRQADLASGGGKYSGFAEERERNEKG